ncbi:MAG: hypothetical protein ABIQ08_14025 [Duganella sp.]
MDAGAPDAPRLSPAGLSRPATISRSFTCHFLRSAPRSAPPRIVCHRLRADAAGAGHAAPDVVVAPQYDTTHVYVQNADIDATKAAVETGADVTVEPFDDPIGKDVLIQWAGGVNMQLYWHTKAPSYAPLHSVPDNRVYVSRVSADKFIGQFKQFAHAKIVADDKVDGGEIGRAGEQIRRVHLTSNFGKVTVFVSDGKLPFPFGRETTGYQVDDMAATLTKAAANDVTVLSAPYNNSKGNASAILRFPGGYISEIHDAAK